MGLLAVELKHLVLDVPLLIKIVELPSSEISQGECPTAGRVVGVAVVRGCRVDVHSQGGPTKIIAAYQRATKNAVNKFTE